VPELPEVETVRRGLAANVVGRLVERVEIGRERTVRRTSAVEVVQGLTGSTIVAAERRGKYLICPLDTGRAVMIHLRMSGQLLVAPAGALRPPHTHVVAHLAPSPERAAEELWFVDPRTFGEVVVFDPAHPGERVPELERLGIDPVADPFDRSALRRLVLGRRRRLKALLLDQHVIAGIGNIYSDEILHRARLRPDRVSNSLHGREITRLHAAIHEVLLAAIETGGSTLRDAQYVDVTGTSGAYQAYHRVYGRAGQRCLTCGRGTVVSETVAGRTTQYCPRCQR
jgi:formamidopyrimidine-DNA glycosylase